MKKIKQIFTEENILTATIFGPAAIAILVLVFQCYWFTFTGGWVIPGDQLAVGIVTSLIYAFGLYKLWVYLKLLNTETDAG